MGKLKVDDTIQLSPVLHDIEDYVQDEWNRVALPRAISDTDLVHAVTLVSEDATVGIAQRYFFRTCSSSSSSSLLQCFLTFATRVVNVVLRRMDREKAEAPQVCTSSLPCLLLSFYFPLLLIQYSELGGAIQEEVKG